MTDNRELALVLKLVADQFQSELKKSGGLLGDFQKAISDWRVQLTAVGTALFAIAKSTANYGDELFKTSQKVGIQVEALAGLQYAAKLANVEHQQLHVGLQALSRAMVDASQRSGEGFEAFQRVGISATDANGNLRPMHDVLLDLADVFARSKDGAGKTEVAMKLLGKSGADLIPLLNGGRASIVALEAEAKRLGLVLSKQNAEAASAFNDELTRLQGALNGLKIAVGTALIPPLTAGAAAITTVIEKMRLLNSETTVVAQNLKNMSQAFGDTKLGQGLMDAFTALGFGHRKGEGTLPREQFWFDLMKSGGGLQGQAPGSGVLAPGAGGPGQAEIAPGTDAKKKAEDYRHYLQGLLSMAEDYRSKIKGTGDDMVADFKDQLKKQQEGYRLYIDGLTALGTEYQNSIKGTGDEAVKLFQENQKEIVKERKIVLDNAQAWIAYYEQVGGTADGLYAARMNLIRANLAQELNLNEEQAGKLLIAWQNRDQTAAEALLARTDKTAREIETIELRTLQASIQAKRAAGGDFIEGWSIGMSRYINDTTSAFGLAVDMARRTAQMMEQSFRQFFFDFFEGRIQSLKDVLRSFGNFVKQLMAQIMAQIATMMVLKGASTFFGGGPLGGLVGPAGDVGGFQLRNHGGLIEPRRFAFGVVVPWTNADSVPAMLTPGEGVLNRRGMTNLDRLNFTNGLEAGPTNLTVNIHGSGRTDQPQVNFRRQMKGMIVDIIWRDPDLRQMFGRA